MSFEVAVQSAVYAALIANADIVAESIPVHDAVPQPDSVENSQYPYITIGEDNHTQTDTDTEKTNMVSIDINVWSRQEGRAETKRRQGYINDALDRANLSFAGYKFINIMRDSSVTFLDADGITRHGVQVFNLMIEEL